MSEMLFTPQNTMYLWWLANPQVPALIGDLKLVDGNRRVSLTYDATWLNQGFPLSEDMPLIANEWIPTEKDRAAGAVDDARPDHWGQRIIQLVDKPSRLSIMEYLYLAGDDRTGALGVSRSRDSYRPHQNGPLPTFSGLSELEQVIRQVMENQPVNELQKRLLRPGASLGGARPKSLITMDGEAWIVKFAENASVDTPLIEHAAMSLARTCGINTAETRALRVGQGHAVAVRRFDRNAKNRLHFLTANVALQAAGESLGYPELSQLLRRLSEAVQVKSQQEQLFRRMVFNILIDNTDDHEKNHAMVRQQNGYYLLSPAYDVLPTAQGLRYQQMRVGKDASASTIENALSEAHQFGLTPKVALQIVKDISKQTAKWRPFFIEYGVKQREIDYLEPYLDGDYLRGQRGQ